MASVLATISEMLIMGGASLKVIFDVVTAYPFEHNFQVRKGDKERFSKLVTAAGSYMVIFRKNPVYIYLRSLVLFERTKYNNPQWEVYYGIYHVEASK